MDASIRSLGECRFDSPLSRGGCDVPFKTDADRVLFDHTEAGQQIEGGASFEVAGPREKIFFEPHRTTAAIVTCGGISPGLNDIIRGLVIQLESRYGVRKVYGFKYGYEGLIQRFGHTPMALRSESVAQIHNMGGTILGSSRGPQDIGEMVDCLEEMAIDIFFVLGGDGTLKGAERIAAEIEKRGIKKSVIGIPKTIDNDILLLDKSFGFETAFGVAVDAVKCAHVESLSCVNGIGLVRLMGRHSGFIASYASLAAGNVDYVLVPEVPFELDGPRGLLEQLRYRLARRKSAVIVVAEGAGQNLLNLSGNTDASGNQRLGDIGMYLKEKITDFFKGRNIPASLKYLDPSYMIRGVPANAADNVYCQQLAQAAVHAGMAGKTSMLVGRWHGAFVNLPFNLVTGGRRKIDPRGELWHSVLEATGQPARLL